MINVRSCSHGHEDIAQDYQMQTGGRASLRELTMRLGLCMQAIKWPRVSWHVYAGHALMEWYQNHGLKTQNLAHSIHIVKKVFDLGLEAPHVQCVPEYIRTYANWLVSAL